MSFLAKSQYYRKVGILATLMVSAMASSGPSRPVLADNLPAALSDWGGPGLMQTPTARMFSPGTVAGGLAVIGGVQAHYYAGMQPLPWLWLTARNSAYTNPYLLTEPGLDIAVRLAKEGPLNPAVVVGGRDVTGSGLPLPGIGRFAGEYLVVSRRWWSLDISAGLGWGRLGNGLTLPNPVPSRDWSRPTTGEAARGPRNWFSGRRVGVLAGAVWHTPLEGLALMAELSPDTLKPERQEDPSLRRPLPFNLGGFWRPSSSSILRGLDIGMGWERGDRFMLRIALRPDPDQLNSDRPDPPPIVPRPVPAAAHRLESLLPPGLTDGALPLFPAETSDHPPTDAFITQGKKADLPIRALTQGAHGAVAWLEGDLTTTTPPARDIGRTMRLMAATLPPDDNPWLTVAFRPLGLNGFTVSVPREAFLQAAAKNGSPEELWQSAVVTDVAVNPDLQDGWKRWWRTGWHVYQRIVWEESVFENGITAAGQRYADTVLTVTPLPGFIIGSSLRVRKFNGTEALNNWLLPGTRPVRSDLPLYAARAAAIPTLFAGLRFSPAAAWHLGFDAGWLEEMYNGLGGEVLYWQAPSRVAAGLSLHQVWKRSPYTPLGRIRDLPPMATGAATLYWQGDGGDWTASLSAGRYLAGDWGGTVRLSRTLPGNVTLASHLTWTDGPHYPEQAIIGGRLEVGLKLTAPLGDVVRLLGRGASRWLGFKLPAVLETSVRTLGRDAGQSLERPLPLYDSVAATGFGRVTGSWHRLLD